MTDLDRFAELLRREGAGYNQPPDAPADSIWRGVEEGLADAAAASSGTAGGPRAAAAPAAADLADAAPFDVRGYHAPPPTPRDEMWTRIEPGLSHGQPAIAGTGERLSTRRGTRRRAAWAVGLAAAASLVLGLAIGRETDPVAQHETAIVPSPPTSVADRDTDPNVPHAPAALPPSSQGFAEARSPVSVAAAVPPADLTVEPSGAMDAERPAVQRNTTQLHRDYETARYLDRAATMLTAFRIDQRTPASERDLARWAREVLVETRIHLDVPVTRPPAEHALLEDLELVLLQISALGPGSPDFEWQLARESMEWNGTLARLRQARSAGGL